MSFSKTPSVWRLSDTADVGKESEYGRECLHTFVRLGVEEGCLPVNTQKITLQKKSKRLKQPLGETLSDRMSQSLQFPCEK